MQLWVLFVWGFIKKIAVPVKQHTSNIVNSIVNYFLSWHIRKIIYGKDM